MGATGFTGRLIAGELVRGTDPFILAGRNTGKLQRLAAELGDGADTDLATDDGRGSRPIATERVDVTDPASLARLIQPGDCVINCVGPFAELGEPVVRACVETGAHYLDTSGEQTWMREMHDRYDTPARDAGLAVVNGMAFEWALGDCAAALAARRLNAPLRTLDVVYAWRDPVTSRGTRRTSVRIAGTRSWQLEQGRWRRRPTGASRRAFSFASGRTLDAITFGAGEVVTVPRWSEAETIRGWLVVGGSMARLAPLVAPAMPLLVPALRPLLDWLVTRADEPDEEARRTGRFTVRVEAEDTAGESVALEVRGRDAYGTTAAVAVLAARRALAPGPPAGVLAPSQLLEPESLLDSVDVLVELDDRR